MEDDHLSGPAIADGLERATSSLACAKDLALALERVYHERLLPGAENGRRALPPT